MENTYFSNCGPLPADALAGTVCRDEDCRELRDNRPDCGHAARIILGRQIVSRRDTNLVKRYSNSHDPN